jgi:hypothetical protein
MIMMMMMMINSNTLASSLDQEGLLQFVYGWHPSMRRIGGQCRYILLAYFRHHKRVDSIFEAHIYV